MPNIVDYMLQPLVKGAVTTYRPGSAIKMQIQPLQPFNKIDVVQKTGFLLSCWVRHNDRLSSAEVQSLLDFNILKLKNSHEPLCDAVCKMEKSLYNTCIYHMCWITTVPVYAKPAKIFTLLLSLVELTRVSWSSKLWYSTKSRNCWLNYIWIIS